MNNTNTYTHHNQNFAKRHKIKKIHDPARAILQKFSQQFGSVYVEILHNWPFIIGTKYAEIAKVSSLKYIKNPARQNISVLTIACPSAHIPILQMQTPQILHRINGYFGYAAVVQIKFTASSSHIKVQPCKKAPQQLSDASAKAIHELTSSIENTELKNALNGLGASLFLKQQDSYVNKK